MSLALLAACDGSPSALRDTRATTTPVVDTSRHLVVAGVARVAVRFDSGGIDTTTWRMPVGGLARFRVTAYDSVGNALPVSGPRFQSSDTAVLAVDAASGRAEAVGIGTAVISASVSGATGEGPSVTVVDTVFPVPPPPKPDTTPTPKPDTTSTPGSAGHVGLSVQRFDGQSGTVLVSNGIPLTKGLLTAAGLGEVHLMVNGTEQRISIRPLAGHFPDGSLRAVLLQFDYNLDDPFPVLGALVTGGGRRTLPDLAPRPSPTVPAAAALPSDPAYLVATRWGGLQNPATAIAPTAIVSQFEGDFVRLETGDWKTCGTKYECGRTAGYDRGFIVYQAWLRTANPTYWYHATAIVADYLTRYIVPNASPTPWWSQTEGVALHYWATGDENSRYELRKMAEMMAWQGRPGYSYVLDGTYGDDRMRAKILMAGLDAAMLEVSTQPADASTYYRLNGGTPYYSQFLTPSTVPAWITGILGTQRTNGEFGGRYYSGGVWNRDVGGQSNYMVGMLMSALIRYYEEVTPDPRIPPAVKKCLDDLWANEWDAKAQAFQYHSLRGTDEGSTTPAKSNLQPGLNGFMALPFAWYARVSGDLGYQDKLDAILGGLASPVSRNWWPSSGKAFDEAFYRLSNTFAWRSGLR